MMITRKDKDQSTQACWSLHLILSCFGLVALIVCSDTVKRQISDVLFDSFAVIVLVTSGFTVNLCDDVLDFTDLFACFWNHCWGSFPFSLT